MASAVEGILEVLEQLKNDISHLFGGQQLMAGFHEGGVVRNGTPSSRHYYVCFVPTGIRKGFSYVPGDTKCILKIFDPSNYRDKSEVPVLVLNDPRMEQQMKEELAGRVNGLLVKIKQLYRGQGSEVGFSVGNYTQDNM